MRRAFTLVEVVVSITVLGVVAAVTLPLVGSVSSSYAAAADVRERTERVAFAVDRCVRLLREVPAGADSASISVTAASSSSILLSDGRGLEVSGGTLLLRQGSSTFPLCRSVTSFTISCLATDGVTSTLATPASTHVFRVSLTADGVTLAAAAFPRARMIKP